MSKVAIQVPDTKPEAYAVARLRDHELDRPLLVDTTYLLEAGIQARAPEDFVSQRFTLPDDSAEIDFEIGVYAEDMEVEPNWLQPYVYDRRQEPSLLTFRIKPTLPGTKQICVDFYHRRHWLAKIEFQVHVDRVPVPDPV